MSRGRLRQLVLCLLDNARKAVGSEGHVSMTVGFLKVSGDPSLPAGEYVLGWRWDSEETAQVWSNCADVKVTGKAEYV